MFDLIAIGLEAQKQALEANAKVIQFPTTEQARQIRAQGKKLVHKPESLKHFKDDDFPPEAA